MFCPSCGSAIDDNATICPKCGVAVSANSQPVQQEFVNPETEQYTEQPQEFVNPQDYTSPAYQQPYGQQPYQPNFASQLPMGWFKFLIYFSLFASAVLNFINGVLLVTGNIYGDGSELVYYVFNSLKPIDMLTGVSLILLAALCIYTRFRLSGYYKNGPQFLNVLYILVCAIYLIYIIAVNVIVGSEIDMGSSFSSLIIQIITSIVMVIVNSNYFKKRAHMFVK